MLTFYLNFWLKLAIREYYNLDKIDGSEIPYLIFTVTSLVNKSSLKSFSAQR